MRYFILFFFIFTYSWTVFADSGKEIFWNQEWGAIEPKIGKFICKLDAHYTIENNEIENYSSRGLRLEIKQTEDSTYFIKYKLDGTSDWIQYPVSKIAHPLIVSEYVDVNIRLGGYPEKMRNNFSYIRYNYNSEDIIRGECEEL